jgi:hypothetical protein
MQAIGEVSQKELCGVRAGRGPRPIGRRRRRGRNAKGDQWRWAIERRLGGRVASLLRSGIRLRRLRGVGRWVILWMGRRRNRVDG